MSNVYRYIDSVMVINKVITGCLRVIMGCISHVSGSDYM